MYAGQSVAAFRCKAVTLACHGVPQLHVGGLKAEGEAVIDGIVAVVVEEVDVGLAGPAMTEIEAASCRDINVGPQLGRAEGSAERLSVVRIPHLDAGRPQRLHPLAHGWCQRLVVRQQEHGIADSVGQHQPTVDSPHAVQQGVGGQGIVVVALWDGRQQMGEDALRHVVAQVEGEVADGTALAQHP